MALDLMLSKLKKKACGHTGSCDCAQGVGKGQGEGERVVQSVIHKASGEGSRGGKVIGHTSSGKPIYSNYHGSHGGFSKEEHKEAIQAQFNKPDGFDASRKYSVRMHQQAVKDIDTDAALRAGMREAKKKVPLDSKKSELDNTLDLIKSGGIQREYPDVDSPVVQRPKKRTLIKASGPGGVLFDFGDVTGNPIADRWAAALNQYGEQNQMGILKYQTDTVDEALVEFVTKGEAAYSAKHSISPEQQDPKVMEELMKSKEVVQASKIQVGNEEVTAQSVTDAQVVDMMKASGMDFSASEDRMLASIR